MKDFDASDILSCPDDPYHSNGVQSYIGADGNLPYFLAADFRTKHRIFTARELAGLPLPPVAWTVENMIPQGLAILAARMKIGKTNFSTSLAKAVGTGEDFMGLRVQQGRVLYLQYEDADQLAQRRIRKLGLQDVDGVDIALDFGSLADKANMQALGDILVSKTYQLVIIDTWERAHIGADTADRNWLREAFDKLQKTARQTRMTILLVDHLNKSFERYGDIFDAIAESSVKIANADTLMALSAHNGKHQLKIRSRYAMETTYTLHRAPGSIQWEIVDDLPASSRKIYAWMHANDIAIVDATTVQQQLGLPSSTAYHALGRLIERNYLVKEGTMWRLPDLLEASVDKANPEALVEGIQWD